MTESAIRQRAQERATYTVFQDWFTRHAIEKAWSKIEGSDNRRPDPWTFDLTFLQGRLEQEIKEYADAKTLQEKANECLDIANFCFYYWAAVYETRNHTNTRDKP